MTLPVQDQPGPWGDQLNQFLLRGFNADGTLKSSSIDKLGQVGGVATLDNSGKIPPAQMPSVAINNTYVVADQAARLALAANVGDVAIQIDVSESFILQATPASTNGNWIVITTPAAPVTSVAGKIGIVTLVESDIANLAADLAAREVISSKGVAGGYASLDGSALVPTAMIPALPESRITNLTSDLAAKEALANKGVANGYAGLDAGGLVSPSAVPNLPESKITNLVADLAAKEAVANKGATNGYASLDGSTTVPVAQIPALPESKVTNLVSDLAAKEAIANKGAAGGYASLDGSTTVPVAQIPALPESKVTNLVSDLAAKEAIANKGVASGYASLDGSTKVPVAQIPALPESGITGLVGDLAATEKTANKGVANGYASLDSGILVPVAQIPSLAESKITGLVADLAARELTANKGAVNGYASLDAGTKVPIAQIPAIPESGVTNLVTDLAAKEVAANKGAANGYASLDASSLVPVAQIPPIAESGVTNLVSDLALTEKIANKGVANGYAGLDANGRISLASMAGFMMPLGGTTDDIPTLQALYDAGIGQVNLVNGQSYYFNSGFFMDDATIATTQRGQGGFVININGAKVTLGPGCPQIAEWNAQVTAVSPYVNGITARCCFFPNTKRTALSGGIVTCTGNTMAFASGCNRLTVNGPGAIFSQSSSNAGLICSSSSVVTVQGVTSNCLFLITNATQADESAVDRCTLIGSGAGANSLGQAIWTFLPVGTSIGDNYSISDCKADTICFIGLFIGSRSVRVSGQNAGVMKFVTCAGVSIESHHQEAGLSNPAGQGTMVVDCSYVTIDGGSNLKTGRTTQYLIEINDTQAEPRRSMVDLDATIFNSSLENLDIGAGADPTLPAHIRITAANKGTRIRGRNVVGTYTAGSDGGLRTADGQVIMSSAVAGIQTACDSLLAKDCLAHGNFELRQRSADGVWEVVSPYTPGQYILLKGQAPTGASFAAIGVGIGESTLTPSTQYAYAACTLDANGNNGPLAQLGQITLAATNPPGAIRFTAGVKDAPKILRIWRQSGSATVVTADRYIDIPFSVYSGRLYDSGANINGQAWKTSSIPALPGSDTSTVGLLIVDNGVHTLIQSTAGPDYSSAYTQQLYAHFGTSNVVVVANTAYLTPIWLPGNVTFSFTALKCGINSTSGNMDIGITNPAQTSVLYSKGSTATPANGSASLAVSGTLTGGSDFWGVLIFDNATVTPTGASGNLATPTKAKASMSIPIAALDLSGGALSPGKGFNFSIA